MLTFDYMPVVLFVLQERYLDEKHKFFGLTIIFFNPSMFKEKDYNNEQIYMVGRSRSAAPSSSID